MYPAQTSLIPVYVALAGFWERNGWLSALGNYPYWYKGETPFYYLTGPFVPILMILGHKIDPYLSLFEISFLLIGFSWLIGGLGVFFFVNELKEKGTNPALLTSLFFLTGPIVPFLFRFSDGVSLIGFSFLPFVLLIYFKLIKFSRTRDGLLLSLSVILLLLLSPAILPTLFLGLTAIFLSSALKQKTEEKLKISLIYLSLALLVVTFWYRPGYWLTLLGAPSFAGKELFSVILSLLKLLPQVLAVAAAVFFNKIYRRRETLRDFIFYWLFIFVFLTLIRFLSDPDFWLDWSAYGTELQFGLALVLGVLLTESGRLKMEKGVKYAFSVLYLLTFFLIFKTYVLGTLQKDISKTPEYKISNWLSANANENDLVFLSGTSAFWLNSLSGHSIRQVRGGVDQASNGDDWRKATWETREGKDIEKTLKWLKTLEIKYLVVHTDDSAEYYHDFKYPEKFEAAKSLRKVFEENGDIIYRFTD